MVGTRIILRGILLIFVLNYLRQGDHLDKRFASPGEEVSFGTSCGGTILDAKRVRAYCSGKTQEALRFR